MAAGDGINYIKVKLCRYTKLRVALALTSVPLVLKPLVGTIRHPGAQGKCDIRFTVVYLP